MVYAVNRDSINALLRQLPKIENDLPIDSNSDTNRRNFIRKASLAAVAVCLPLTQTAGSVRAEAPPKRVPQKTLGKHFAMVIDMEKCIGCDACTISCKAENNVPMGVYRTWVETHERGRFPNIKLSFAPKLCNHCDDPPCVPVCPVDATFKRSDGLVLVDYDKCIGCGYCVEACPYGARYMDPVTHVVDKCTFCVQRIEQGLTPACVETCVGGPRIFGDINNSDDPVSMIINTNAVQVLKTALGTRPRVYYVGLDEGVV